MTIDNLYSIITNSNWYNGNSLRLPADAVDTNGPVYTLTNTWMGSALYVANITQKPVKSGNTVKLSGSMNILNLNNLVVQDIVFSIIDGNGQPTNDGNPALFIDLPLPPAWTFSASFPTLSGTPVDGLTFLQAHFLLSSWQQAAANNYPVLQPGLNFYSPSLQTSSTVLAMVKGLIGGGETLAISGPITIISGNITVLPQLLPGLTLSSPTANITLASFLTLPVTLQVNSSLVPPLNNLGAFVLLSSQVQIGSEPPIGISVDISNLGKVVVFRADIGKAVTHSLQELASFLNNAPVGDELKKYIDKLSDHVTVSDIRVYLNTKAINQDITKALSAIAVDVGSTGDWNLLPGYFDLQSFDVTFMVNKITTSPSINTIVDGNVVFVDDIYMLLSASFPDVSFDIQLQPDHPIQLSDIFKKLWPAAAGYADITCNEFDLSGTPGQSTYSLSAGFTAGWNINSGVRQINLEEAILTLNYDSNAKPTTSGSLNAAVDFVGDDDNPIAEFIVNWSIPGPFQLQGNFPDINLTSLAKAIVNVADLSLPSSFPQIDLKNSVVTLTVISGTNNAQGTVYDFSLTSTVQFNNTDLGLLFEIQKTPQTWGCVAGIWTEKWSWSPAEQWPVFKDILNGIAFSNTGLLISSIQNPTVQIPNPPSKIPTTIGVGLTFFTEIDLSGKALSALKKFFPEASAINFYAYLADPLNNSTFTGTIGGSSNTQKYSFDGLTFSVTPANESFTVKTGVTFSFTEIAGPQKGQPVKLDFIGGATISLLGDFDLFFVLKANGTTHHEVVASRLARHARRKQALRTLPSPALQKPGPPPNSPGWKDPLGLQGITVENFWGEVGLTAEGVLSFGFGGSVAIGDTNPVDLEMDLDGGVDGEVPVLNAFIFKLVEEDQSKSIQLTDLIKKFTTLDLNWVPILNGISFKEFQLYIVLNPAGFKNPATGTVYPMGFFSSGDITFYGFEAIFDVEIYFSTGIKAYGYINKPISIAGGILQLSDANGDTGPYGLIDTTFLINPKPGKPYLKLSGSITLLGFTDTLYAYIESGAFYFEMKLNNFVLKEHVICSLNYSTTSVDFTGSIGGDIDLHVSTPPVSKDDIPVLPAITIDFDLDLTIVIKINPGFTFHVAGSFSWGTLTLTTDFYLVDITSWNDLKTSIEDFFTKYPKELWRDLLSDVNKLVSALEQKLFVAASDVGKILYNAFHVGAEDAAKFLSDLGWSVEQIIEALENIWGKSKQEAEQIVSGIAKYCSVTQAYAQAGQPSVYTMRPDMELLEAMALAPHAQDILYEYYKNQPVINALSSTDQELRARLRRMLNDHLRDGNATPPIEDIIIYFKELGKKAGPQAKDIEPLISKLRPYRSLTYQDFVKAMQQSPNGLITDISIIQ